MENFDEAQHRLRIRREAGRNALRAKLHRLSDRLALLGTPVALARARTRGAFSVARGQVSDAAARIPRPHPGSAWFPRLTPRTRRIATWVTVFAALTVAEVLLALPLLTGTSREAAPEVPAATEIVVQQTSERRRGIDSVLADKAGSRGQPSATGRPSGPGSGKRGTPVVAAGVEDSTDAVENTEVQAPDDSDSARDGDVARNEKSAPSDVSSTPRDAPRSSIRRGIPLAPAPKVQSPSPQQQGPSPQPQSPPPPPQGNPPPPPPAPEPPPPSTTIVTRTTIRTSPPPPPSPPHSTTTTVASSPSTTTTSGDGDGCRGRRCDKDKDEDEDEDEDDDDD